MTDNCLKQLKALPVWGAEELKEAQEFLGFTNQALADLLKVNLRTVELWRQGKFKVSKPAKVLLFLLCWTKFYKAEKEYKRFLKLF